MRAGLISPAIQAAAQTNSAERISLRIYDVLVGVTTAAGYNAGASNCHSKPSLLANNAAGCSSGVFFTPTSNSR